jgi:hypothetical protein
MAIQIQSTNGLSAKQGIKVLTYGRAGAGKTRLCATAPSPIIFSAEGGLLSLRKLNLPYIEVTTMAKLREVYDWAKKSNEARQFQTLCLDSITEIGEVVLKAELAKTKDPRQAYGALITELTGIVKDFRDLPGRNVYFSCKEEFSRDDANGGMLFQPSMPGSKMGPSLPYLFDEVFRLISVIGADGKQYPALQTQLDNQSVAKDRSGALDPLEQANLASIFAKIAA